jgi:hypothetical protein
MGAVVLPEAAVEAALLFEAAGTPGAVCFGAAW